VSLDLRYGKSIFDYGLDDERNGVKLGICLYRLATINGSSQSKDEEKPKQPPKPHNRK
jgi:hypothetical protein